MLSNMKSIVSTPMFRAKLHCRQNFHAAKDITPKEGTKRSLNTKSWRQNEP
jgi:hypothetical protein